jgi:hypothetical protein
LGRPAGGSEEGGAVTIDTTITLKSGDILDTRTADRRETIIVVESSARGFHLYMNVEQALKLSEDIKATLATVLKEESITA